MTNSGKPAMPRKPYLKGTLLGAPALKRGLRVMVLVLMSAVLFLLAGQLMLLTGGILRILINLLVLAAFYLFMLSDGAAAGEEDVGFAEIMYQRAQDGLSVVKKDLARCYHPLKGLLSVCVGMMPVLIVFIVFSAVATRQVYHLGALPEWLSAFEGVEEVGGALSYYRETLPVGLENILRVPVRLLLFPYVTLMGGDSGALLMLERLSPLLVMAAPLFHAAGYLLGPARRARVHADIANAKKAKARKEKKERRKRMEDAKRII